MAPSISNVFILNPPNNEASITFSEAVFQSDGTTPLTTTQLTLAITGGVATLSSYTLTTSDNTNFNFDLVLIGVSDGTETLTLTGTVYNVSQESLLLNQTVPLTEKISPTAIITYDSAGPYKNGDTVVITATFSEDMALTPLPKIIITGTNIADVAAVDMVRSSATEYTYSYAVPSGDGTGDITLSTGTDLAGNVLASTPSTNTFSVDNTPPTMAITSTTAGVNSSGLTTNDYTIALTFTASEPITGFLVDDITLTNCSIGTLTADSTSVYTATITPSSDGLCEISVGTNKFLDLADNLNSVASNTFQWTFDSTSPTMTITSTTTGVTSGSHTQDATIALTFTSSEITTDFTIDDIILTNGTLGVLSGSGTIYNATFTPTAQGISTIKVLGSKFTDAPGNNNGASNIFEWTYDVTAPTLTAAIVSNNATSTLAKPGDVVTLTMTSSETIGDPTVVFLSGGAAVTDTSITYVNTTSTNNTCTAEYTVNASDTDGLITYTINYVDLASNSGVQVTNGTGAVTVDTTLPTLLSVSIVSNNATTTLAKPSDIVTLTITASETIGSPTIAFTTGGVSVAGAITIQNTSGDTWTAIYTTVAGDTDGVVGFTVDFLDTVGNVGVQVNGVSDGSAVTFDKTLPTVYSFVMDDVALKKGDTASVTITFTEAVPGFDSDVYITAENGTLDKMTPNVGNTVWTGFFTPTDIIEDATNILTLAVGYVDSAGNVATQSATTVNYEIDTSRPVLTSVTPITYNGTTTVYDRTPSYIFHTTQAGTITTSNATFSSTTAAVIGDNVITFDILADYTTHNAITIIVTDPAGNPSIALTVPEFIVDTTTSTLDIINNVSNHAEFDSILNANGITDHTSKTVEIHTTTNPHTSYKPRITFPNGDFSVLTDANKTAIKAKVAELYASELNIVSGDTIYVDMLEGSVIIDVYVMTTAAVSSNISICFPKGTPVTTNQGEVPIENLRPGFHTIRGKKITAITCTRPNTSHIVLIKKHALGKNVPCASTQISNHHRVFYKGHMVKASNLVNMCEGVVKTPYNGETLYNVVMKKHDKMMINNLICETLHPENAMARICAGEYTHREKVELCAILKRIGKTNDYETYTKFYASLK